MVEDASSTGNGTYRDADHRGRHYRVLLGLHDAHLVRDATRIISVMSLYNQMMGNKLQPLSMVLVGFEEFQKLL